MLIHGHDDDEGNVPRAIRDPLERSVHRCEVHEIRAVRVATSCLVSGFGLSA